ncbi:helix-turn-helix transcriptional regulator [Actinomadura sp. 21ATH]|uniref:helix-turn-helix transcriptional regulator n=1 Tax=Actinomadura sp. 21ATH TaxID=1735444 RepID=UPI0035C16778
MPGRMLRLLSLLQSRREWSGAELAERLGVTDRTVRRDVERLRALDYPVEGVTGTAGGYRLVSGRDLPPLLLDDDEAVAVALGLATAAGSVPGIGEIAMRALAKLERVLPARLRPRLASFGGVTAAVPHPKAPHVDPGVLAVLASCSRDHEVLSFDHRARSGTATARRVEPYALVTLNAHWYLLAYDPDRAGWRTFRVDRIARPVRTHRRFAPRELPGPDAAAYLTRSFATASYRYTARMTVRLTPDEIRSRLFATPPGTIEPAGPGASAVRLTADSAELVVQYVAALASLGAGFTLDAPEEITGRVRRLGRALAP